MLRFRLGQRWKLEGLDGEPHDAFRLEVDEVNLLKGVNEEPLVRAMIALVDAVGAVQRGKAAAGQLAFESAAVQVCLNRVGDNEVELSVVSLGNHPQRLKGPIQVGLDELVLATSNTARAFLRDGRRLLKARQDELATLELHLKQLSEVSTERFEASEGWGMVRTHHPGLGFVVCDRDGRSLRYSRRAQAALSPLLVDGGLVLPSSGELVLGSPVLQLLGLTADASEGAVRLGSEGLSPRAVFEAGLALCVALRARNHALGGNPYLEALQVRCTDGLALLREAPPEHSPKALPAAAKSADSPPIARGEVRRLGLKVRWERQAAVGEEGARLAPTPGGLTVASRHMAQSFSNQGVPLASVAGPTVLVVPQRAWVCQEHGRLWLVDPKSGAMEWFRACGDLPPLGRFGQRAGEVLVLETRGGCIALDSMTGRERWRSLPRQAQRAHVALLGKRVLVGSELGVLLGLDADDGEVRFRIKTSTPVVAAPIRAGSRGVALLSRLESTTVFSFDIHASLLGGQAGALSWSQSLTLATPAPPLFSHGRLFIAGVREGAPMVCALGPRGVLLWERRLPSLRAESFSLLAFEGGVIVADTSGGAVRLLPDGEMGWVLGGQPEELQRSLPLTLCRQLLVVPGPTVRVIEPRSGRSVAELPLGADLADLMVDRQLRITAWCEPGRLLRVEPQGHLAVV